jgi:hypothetical protein
MCMQDEPDPLDAFMAGNAAAVEVPTKQQQQQQQDITMADADAPDTGQVLVKSESAAAAVDVDDEPDPLDAFMAAQVCYRHCCWRTHCTAPAGGGGPERYSQHSPCPPACCLWRPMKVTCVAICLTTSWRRHSMAGVMLLQAYRVQGYRHQGVAGCKHTGRTAATWGCCGLL